MSENKFPAVKNRTSGRQTVTRGRIRIGRFNPIMDFELQADNATNEEHMEFTVNGEHYDIWLPLGEYADLHEKLRGGDR